MVSRRSDVSAGFRTGTRVPRDWAALQSVDPAAMAARDSWRVGPSAAVSDDGRPSDRTRRQHFSSGGERQPPHRNVHGFTFLSRPEHVATQNVDRGCRPVYLAQGCSLVAVVIYLVTSREGELVTVAIIGGSWYARVNWRRTVLQSVGTRGCTSIDTRHGSGFRTHATARRPFRVHWEALRRTFEHTQRQLTATCGQYPEDSGRTCSPPHLKHIRRGTKSQIDKNSCGPEKFARFDRGL